jgi:hypothetical protein
MAHQRLAAEPSHGDLLRRPAHDELQQQQALDRIGRGRHRELASINPAQAIPFLLGHHDSYLESASLPV